MIVSLIVAVAENGVIGRNGGLPWHLPADLANFKKVTTGHTVIMGRRTFDELGKPLPGRRNLVVSRNPGLQIDGATVAHDLDEAFALAEGEAEVFVLGGEQIFRQALPAADRLYLTLVHAEVDGDTRFPAFWGARDWELVESRPHPQDDRHAHAFDLRVYERRRREAP